LQDDGESKDKEDKPVDKVDDGLVEVVEFGEGDHRVILYHNTVPIALH
jgi:hypothetical protein